MLKMNSDHLRRNAMANSKDVVVTGVSTGIGWGTTKVLVSKGFRVFGSVRKQADADRLQREFGNGFVPLLMDVTDVDAVHQAAQKFIVAEARNNGLSPERLGEAVHVALSTAKPKARYAVVPQRFKNWTLPRLLPVRMLDAQLAKLLGLTSRSQPRTAGSHSS
jgi:NAD(P)-dependent dehydrogenase (short-subunit alcohol dehydrogenase family)